MTKSAEWNRGAYLVQGLEHCGACHTPKTWLRGDDQSHAFQGYALQGWFAPNITNDSERGLGKWSIADVAACLKVGHNPGTAATGIMAEEIMLSSSQMTDADLTAIATYLKDLPEQTASPPAAVSPPIRRSSPEARFMPTNVRPATAWTAKACPISSHRWRDRRTSAPPTRRA